MQKTEVPGVYKEREGVLINKDNEALAAYKKRKMQSKRLDKLEQEMSEIKSTLNDIRTILLELVK